MCVRPMNVKGNVVPCSKCFECKQFERVSWSIRVQHEIKEGSFITLTYDDEHNPIKLQKSHLVNYLKRIREEERKNGHTNIKYFAVGEYGSIKFTHRPHYHIIINTINNDIIEKKWQYGHVYIGKITDASIHYCTKYVQKNIGWKKDQTEEKEYREFRLMSKGLGLSYLNRHKDYYEKNQITYIVKDGIKYSLPRYYKNKIFGNYTTINKETGEITTHEKTDLRELYDKLAEVKLKKLVKLYGNMLHSEVDENKRKYYEKFNSMLFTLKLLKK